TKNSDGSIIETIQPQAAAVVFDYSTGQLRAIVGGRDAPDVKKSINRVTATMPVGSAIKPLAVYAPALDLGASPATIIPNVPVPIDGWNTATGYPATSSSTYGPVSIRTGLTKSINIVAARVLMDYVGLEKSKEYLMSMGINPKHINVNPAGLALGTSGITPLEMAVAFGCIANDGQYISPISFTKVVDTNGNVIVDATKTQVYRQAIKASTAYMLVDILEDVVSKGTGKNARLSGLNVGGKTGTNQENRGIYFCGITPYYSASLWIGHDDYKPLKSNAYASSYAAPLWQDFMSDIHEDLENKPIIDASPESLGLVKATVCPVSGMLATENCESAAALSGRKLITDWFAEGTVPTEECTWHRPITEICSASYKLATEYCPEETVIMASPLFLHPDSIYFDMDVTLQKKIFPLLFPIPTTTGVRTMTEDNPEYYTYFCDIHTSTWNEESVQRPQAIRAANDMISEVRTFITERVNDITPDESTTLSNLANALETLINDSASTSQEISSNTLALDSYYQQIVEKYIDTTGDSGDTGNTDDNTEDPGDGMP
ncbi:MAG: penicillin-binding transpeptidase domain-containing protein, partial [Eubacteriales bacterium]